MEQEQITQLDELVQLLDDLLRDRDLFVRLEMFEQEETHERECVLAQFAGTYDLCDVVIGEHGEEIALEFLFDSMTSNDGMQESQSIAIPVDPDDVEVNILEQAIEIESRGFFLTIQML
jgi:hypothetical protein